LSLSRNIFFYKEIKLPDTFETRIYLMFFHFSIMMIISKKKNHIFNQQKYDDLFHNIENNLRELGFGDVAVNKKMKDFNKILYDILLKLGKIKNSTEALNIDDKLLSKYFFKLYDQEDIKCLKLKKYFSLFYKFCFELPLENMVRDALNFRN
jgi:cytochrome b pre-mRNA-processing protein 3